MTGSSPGSQHSLRPAVLGLALLATAIAAGCTPDTRDREPFSVREITPAFLSNLPAGDPSLAADAHGAIALTWVTNDSSRADVWLAVSRDSGSSFSAPVRVNLGEGRVVVLPECRPAVAFGPGGSLAIAWSESRADTSGAVDLRVRASADFGRTLGGVTTVNDDVAGPPAGLRWRQRRDWALQHRANAFHGFPALAFTADGSLLAAWLDDRRTPVPMLPRRSTLWRAISRDGGQAWSPNAAVSDSASPGCRPSLATAPDGAVALAYRDGSNDLRDPRLAMSFDNGGAFTADTLVSNDGWRLTDCPGQSPALVWEAPQGGQYLWYTGAPPAGVYVVRWRRAGAAAGLRQPVADSLVNAGHPLVAPLGDALLIGVETHVAGDPGRHALAVRTLDSTGAWSSWTTLGADATSATLAGAGARSVIACWVEHEPGRDYLRLVSLTRKNGARH